MILSTFYGAMNSNVRLSLDVAAGGHFKKAPVHYALLEKWTPNNYAWAPNGTNSVKSAQENDIMNLLTLKLDALTQKVRGQRANVTAISSPNMMIMMLISLRGKKKLLNVYIIFVVTKFLYCFYLPVSFII